jgi:hypothetical protein
MGTPKKLLRVKHCGRLGDVVYSVMVLKAYSEVHDFDLEYCLWDNSALKNLKDEGHLYPGGINDDAISFIKDWLEGLDIKVSKYNGQVCLDLDYVKELGQSIAIPYSDIRKWYVFAYPELNTGKLFFNTDYSLIKENFVLVNRTTRWQNPYIDYSYLNKIDSNIVFIGTDEEFNIFKQDVPAAIKNDVKSLKEAEELIKSCQLYIGNQSLFYAIAEFNQVPRMLEVCTYAPNVVSQGKNHYDFVSNNGFKVLIDNLL